MGTNAAAYRCARADRAWARVLEDLDHALKICEYALPDPSGFAALVFDSHSASLDEEYDSVTLRVCVANKRGLQVHALAWPPRGDTAGLQELWAYVTPQDREYVSQPSFGKRPNTISWFHAPGLEWKPTAFMTATLPVSPSNAQAGGAPYSLCGLDMPALYCMGVRDWDETQGILALGNAFGELVLYDFAGTNSARLDACFKSVDLSQDPEAVLLPQVRAFARPELP